MEVMRPQIVSQVLQLVRHAASLVTDAKSFGQDIVRLAKLEAELARDSLVSIGALSSGVVLLLATGWILLVLSLVMWLADRWLSLPASLLLIGLAMVVCAVPLVFAIKRHAEHLSFKATRRQLGGKP
jgi:uncharacterized membrane protein YqjE